MRNIKSPKI